MFATIMSSALGMTIRMAADGVIRPKEFGVCRKYFASAVNENVRYIHGVPMIKDGTIQGGQRLWMAKFDTDFDLVDALRKLEESQKEARDLELKHQSPSWRDPIDSEYWQKRVERKCYEAEKAEAANKPERTRRYEAKKT